MQAAACVSPDGFFSEVSGLFAGDRDHPILDNAEHPEHPQVSFASVRDEVAIDEEQRREVEARAQELAWKWLARFVGLLALYLVKDGRSKVEGAGIRAFVFASFFLPRLRRLTQPELAAVMNRKHKQSVGREMSEFRDFFGGIIRPGLQFEAGREACRKREQMKRVAVDFEREGASDFTPEIEKGQKA